MKTFYIQKSRLISIFGLFISLFYGLFVIASLQRLYLLDSGDVGSYLHFFSTYDGSSASYTGGDFVFRVGVFLLTEYFNSDTLTILSGLAFITSSAIFTLFFSNIRSSKYLVYLIPLFLIVFLTPLVTNSFASTIRSTIAFTILMFALVSFKGTLRYSLFGLSSLIHLSMVPIVSFFFLFHILKRIKMSSSFIVPFILLAFYVLFVTLIAYFLEFNVTVAAQSYFYNTLILCLTALVIFTNKKTINNLYGFISIALFLVYIFGLILDISFIRYIGYAILFYLFFLTQRAEKSTLQIFTLGYFPFFLIISIYAFL